MVIVDEEKEKFAKAEKLLKELESALDLPALKARKKELEEKQNEEGFWNDVQHAQTVNRELSGIDGKIDGFFKLKARAEDAEALIALVEEDGDDASKAELSAELDALIEELEELRLQTLGRHGGAGLGEHALSYVYALLRTQEVQIGRIGYACRR